MKIKNIIFSLLMVMMMAMSAVSAMASSSTFWVNSNNPNTVSIDGISHGFVVDKAESTQYSCAVNIDGETELFQTGQPETVDELDVRVNSFYISNNLDGTQTYNCEITASDAYECDMKGAYEEGDQFTFEGEYVEVKDIDLDDEQIELKDIRTGITYQQLDVGNTATIGNIKVMPIAVRPVDVSEGKVILCIDEVKTPAKYMPPFVVAVDNRAPAIDSLHAADLLTALQLDGYQFSTVGMAKLFSEVNAQMLGNQVLAAIYGDEAVVILDNNAPAEDELFAHNVEAKLEGMGINTRIVLDADVPSSELIDLFVDEDSLVITQNIGVLTYQSIMKSTLCEFVDEGGPCKYENAIYKYSNRANNIVAVVEQHTGSFTNQQAIDGINYEINRYETYTVSQETLDGNNVLSFYKGSGVNMEFVIAWTSGNNIVGIAIDNKAGTLNDAEFDDVFEDSLAKFYLAKYPSDLEFVNAPIDCTDTDNGNDYYLKGHTKGYNPQADPEFRNQDMWDQCAKDHPSYMYNSAFADKLFEYSCRSNEFYSETHTCPNGCRDGRCYYPGYFVYPEESSYNSGDLARIKIKAADSGTNVIQSSKVNVYIKPPYTTATADTKYLIQRNFVVNRETYFELDLGDYDYIFTQSGHYTFLVTDAVTNDNDLASGRSAKSNFINFVKTSDSVPDTGCTDSDDGYDIYEAGQANGREIGTSDACIGNTLREAVCKNGQATHVEVACPSSAPYCNKGACSASRPKCQDTDGGINPSVKGTVTEARTADGPKHTDYCQDATTKSFMESCSGSNCGLREYYCPSTYTNTMAYNDVKCPNGCRDGVCYGYEDNEIPEVEDDCHLSSLSQFELNEDNVLSFYTVNPQESTIDFGGNHQYGIAQETKVQVVKDPTTDSSFVIRMNRYETSAQANRMFDIINTQHTRQVLFHDTRLGDETFCHVSPDFDDRNPGRYYYICGFRKGNVYVDVQATTTVDSRQSAIDIMEIMYGKISQSSCAAQVPPTVVYAPEESHSMIGKIINGNKNTYSLGGEDYEIEAYLDPTGTEAKFIVEGEATGGLVSMESDPAGNYYHKFSFGAKIAALVFDNNVIKFQFVVGEGEFEEGADVYYSDAEEAVEIIQVVTPSVRPIERAGDCEGQGCLADHSCLSFGIRMMSGSTPAFCDIDGNFKIQKADEKSCQNNYECLSNACASGKCVDFESRLGSLEQEVKETKGILNSLFEWLSRIFGGR